MAETRSLHRKLAQVMYEAERIPKNGKAPKEMGGYPFVQVGDAADYIRKALAEKVITMMPVAVSVVGQVDRVTKNGGNMTTVDLITTWRLTDGESGESIEIQSFGAGADTGDKYSGKASTSAMKYALLSGFLLSTGEDSEGANLPEQRSERNPRVGAADYQPPPARNGGLIGTVKKQTTKTTDFELRQSPDGPFLGFRLKDGDGSGVICEARGPLADALALVRDQLLDQRIQVWGSWVDYAPPVVQHPYRAYRIERIQTPDFVLPAPDVAAFPDSGGATSAAEPSADTKGSDLGAELDALPLFQDDAA